jgi:Predicted membrane protein
MNAVSVIVAAIAPGVALMAYFYLKDKYVTEPIGMVARVFLYGVFLVFPVMVLQRGLHLWIGDSRAAAAFLVSGATEEFFKWFLLYYAVYKHREFDEPYDGIVYSAAVSLGFATLENVLYAWSLSADAATMLLRALLPVSAHALFAVMMGYYFGAARFSRTRERAFLASALLVPMFWHGLYDYLLQLAAHRWMWFVLPLMAILWIRAIWKMQLANDRSPYRPVHAHEDWKQRVLKS